jgi:glycosyltransferase involved in cell wall biosynthesis
VCDVRLNKLAVVLQHGSTGARRYAYRLIEGLCEARPNLEISLYLGQKVLSLKSECDHSGIQQLSDRVRVRSVPSLKATSRRSPLKQIVGVAGKVARLVRYRRWISEMEQHDVAFFAWPYGIELPRLTIPVAFIPHDLNYTHFVGNYVDRPKSLQETRDQHWHWLTHAHSVVSCEFIADELQRTFPQIANRSKVIPISHLSSAGAMSMESALAIVHRLGIEGKFVLCLNNVSAHKNLGQIMSGFHYAQRNHPELKLVLCGFGTENIHGMCRTPFYLDLDAEPASVISMGSRTDLEAKALIQCAAMVINGSLYEAGNGSGLDAWALGTPVAMSSIPPFLEHMRVLGVRAETFHPRCCFEIRDAILRILDQPDVALENVRMSQQAMNRYAWSHVGERYATFFEHIAGASHGLKSEIAKSA